MVLTAVEALTKLQAADVIKLVDAVIRYENGDLR